MVRLTRIYTGGGDGGETSLGDGGRVAKHDIRVEAYGTVDEANAVIGLVRAGGATLPGDVDAMLSRIQNDLFDLGADLCTPEGGKRGDAALRVSAEQAARLEAEIDAINTALAPLNSFVLPGGSQAAAQLHLARTVVRRAERLVAQLAGAQAVNPQVLIYLNRLSDLLFVLARYINQEVGEPENKWNVGRGRDSG